MTYQNILVDGSGAVRTLVVNRPAKLNALDRATLLEIRAAMTAAVADASIGAMVVTGAETGKKPSFVAGADIAAMKAMSAVELREFATLGQSTFDLIEQAPFPVIAAVNGFALGGGCELSMACHIRLASEHALFGQPEINLGIIPGFAGSQRLPRIVGRSKALEMLLGGDPIKADEALRIGLVSTVLPAAELLPKAMELAAKFAAKAPVARRYILDCVVRGASMPFADAQKVEADLFGLVGATEDVRAGLGAFLDRTTAVWQGR